MFLLIKIEINKQRIILSNMPFVFVRSTLNTKYEKINARILIMNEYPYLKRGDFKNHTKKQIKRIKK